MSRGLAWVASKIFGGFGARPAGAVHSTAPGEEGALPIADVTIYTTMFCPYCSRAKKLLSGKGVDFEEIAVDMDLTKRAEMTTRANGGRTVPQIFINDRHIGGSDELSDLDRAGELDQLLAATS